MKITLIPGKTGIYWHLLEEVTALEMKSGLNQLFPYQLQIGWDLWRISWKKTIKPHSNLEARPCPFIQIQLYFIQFE